MFMKKLRFVKDKLKVWNKEVFGDLRVRKGIILKEIEEIDKEELEGSSSLSLLSKKVQLKNELEEIILREEMSWR